MVVEWMYIFMKFFKWIYLLLIFLLLNPTMASAYLDPSAGNALVYIAITLVSVFIYAIKGFFYRITGKNIDNARIKNDIVIFSEGKNYWNTFEPIINALEERRVFIANEEKVIAVQAEIRLDFGNASGVYFE